MFVHDENVFPPEEWDKARARILRRAEAARARALRELAAALLRPLRAAAWAVFAAAGNWWRAYIRRRERNAAVLSPVPNRNSPRGSASCTASRASSARSSSRSA